MLLPIKLENKLLSFFPPYGVAIFVFTRYILGCEMCLNELPDSPVIYIYLLQKLLFFY